MQLHCTSVADSQTGRHGGRVKHFVVERRKRITRESERVWFLTQSVDPELELVLKDGLFVVPVHCPHI